MNAIIGLVSASHVADIADGRDPQPHLHIARMREGRVVSTDLMLDARPHHGLRGDDEVLRRSADELDPSMTLPDRMSRDLCPRGGRIFRIERYGVAVDETDRRVGLHDFGCP